jgi:hypothetical protein
LDSVSASTTIAAFGMPAFLPLAFLVLLYIPSGQGD